MNMIRKILPVPIKNILRPFYYGFFSFLRLVVRTFVRVVSLLLGKKRFLKLSHFIRQEIDTNIVVADIIFDATDYIPFTRAVSVLTKEPEIISWIDDFISEGDVFYDIGANIGVFSLYAAKNKKVTVISFEPFAANYVLLNRNIFLNGLDDRINALNIAVHNETSLSHLNVSEFWPGKAGHSFGKPIGSEGDVYEPKFLQGTIGMSIDDFVGVFDVPFPNHIKIDVDGNEPLIIQGMAKTMSDPRLKSIAIELHNNFPESINVLETIKANGFNHLSDEKYINRELLAVSPVQNHFLVRG